MGSDNRGVVGSDNRDTGFSERLRGEDDLDGGYDLADMGDDILRVLDDLGTASAHIAGRSMGGMTAWTSCARSWSGAEASAPSPDQVR